MLLKRSWPPELGFWFWGVVVTVVISQSCPPPCDPMDYSPPGFLVHGILQARMLKWVAMLFSKFWGSRNEYTARDVGVCVKAIQTEGAVCKKGNISEKWDNMVYIKKVV